MLLFNLPEVNDSTITLSVSLNFKTRVQSSRRGGYERSAGNTTRSLFASYCRSPRELKRVSVRSFRPERTMSCTHELLTNSAFQIYSVRAKMDVYIVLALVVACIASSSARDISETGRHAYLLQ